MNPRWLNYCRANGRSPENQMKFDALRFPGGALCGFILWVSRNRQDFKKKNPGAFVGDTLQDHALFDVWLNVSTVTV